MGCQWRLTYARSIVQLTLCISPALSIDGRGLRSISADAMPAKAVKAAVMEREGKYIVAMWQCCTFERFSCLKMTAIAQLQCASGQYISSIPKAIFNAILLPTLP